MGYKGVVKNNAIVLEDDVELPEGAEVEVITEGWWLSDEARRIAKDRDALQKWLTECDQLRARIRSEMGVTTDSVQIIREMREARANR